MIYLYQMAWSKNYSDVYIEHLIDKVVSNDNMCWKYVNLPATANSMKWMRREWNENNSTVTILSVYGCVRMDKYGIKIRSQLRLSNSLTIGINANKKIVWIQKFQENKTQFRFDYVYL